MDYDHDHWAPGVQMFIPSRFDIFMAQTGFGHLLTNGDIAYLVEKSVDEANFEIYKLIEGSKNVFTAKHDK